MTALELAIDADVERQMIERFPLPTPPTLKRFESQMTALELAIDADVEQQMIERFNLPVTSAQ